MSNALNPTKKLDLMKSESNAYKAIMTRRLIILTAMNISLVVAATALAFSFFGTPMTMPDVPQAQCGFVTCPPGE